MATDSEVLQAGNLIGQSLSGVGSSILGFRQKKKSAEEEQIKIDKAKLYGDELSKTTYGQTEIGKLESLGVANRDITIDDSVKQLKQMDPERLLEMFMTDPNVRKDPKLMEKVNSAIKAYVQYQGDKAAEISKWDSIGKLYGPQGAYGYGQKPVSMPDIDYTPIAPAMEAKYGDGDSAEMKVKRSEVGLPGEGYISVPLNQPLFQTMEEFKKKKQGNVFTRTLGITEGIPEYSPESLNKLQNIVKLSLKKDMIQSIIDSSPVYAQPDAYDYVDAMAESAVNDIVSGGLKNALYEKNADGVTDKPRRKKVPVQGPRSLLTPYIDPQQGYQGGSVKGMHTSQIGGGNAFGNGRISSELSIQLDRAVTLGLDKADPEYFARLSNPKNNPKYVKEILDELEKK